jgi:hypothetical protein
MASDTAYETKWRQFRQLRLAWWGSFAIFLACLFFAGSTLSLISTLAWGILSGVAAFWPCPLCGGRVGYIPLGPFMILWPFDGWCTTCSRMLFLRR